MAAGDSSVSICNIALIALGEAPIVALTDQTKRAILCKARYDDIRRWVLRSYPWNCARKQASIAASATAPLFNWSSAFPLPADWIRFYDQDEQQDNTSIWNIVGNVIMSNQTSPLQINYIFDLQDCTKMDAGLIHTIAYQIVTELGLPITQNQARVTAAVQMLQSKQGVAQNINAQENAPREWDVDILLRSRR